MLKHEASKNTKATKSRLVSCHNSAVTILCFKVKATHRAIENELLFVSFMPSRLRV